MRKPNKQTKPATGRRVQRVVSLRAIMRALRTIQRIRRTDNDRALYGVEQALGWASGGDYMNPINVWDPRRAG